MGVSGGGLPGTGDRAHRATARPDPGALSEFANRDHPLVRLSNTQGTVRVLDGATGKQITAMEPG